MIDFFVIGSPRSGTTLLRLLLNSNPAILVPPECGFVIWLKKYQYNFLHNSKDQFFDSFVQDLLGCRKFSTWKLNEKDIKQGILDSDCNSYQSICRAIHRVYANKHGRTFLYCGDKNNFYTSHVDELRDLFVGSKFIHIIRDGRDIACSYREVMHIPATSPYHPKLPTEISAIAHEWRKNIISVRNAFHKISENNKIEIRYEDIIQDAPTVLDKVCKFIGVPYHSAMLNFHLLNRRSEIEPTLTMDWKQKTLVPVESSSMLRYVRELSQDESNVFIDISGDILNEYKYI